MAHAIRPPMTATLQVRGRPVERPLHMMSHHRDVLKIPCTNPFSRTGSDVDPRVSMALAVSSLDIAAAAARTGWVWRPWSGSEPPRARRRGEGGQGLLWPAKSHTPCAVSATDTPPREAIQTKRRVAVLLSLLRNLQWAVFITPKKPAPYWRLRPFVTVASRMILLKSVPGPIAPFLRHPMMKNSENKTRIMAGMSLPIVSFPGT